MSRFGSHDGFEHNRTWWDWASRDDPNKWITGSRPPGEFDRSGWECALQVVALCPEYRDRTILEWGCGSGRVTQYLAYLFREVWAVDIAPGMIAQLRRRRLPNTRSHLTRGADLPRAARVDIVYSYTCWFHNRKSDLEAILRSCRSVLNPGGRLLFQLPVYQVPREPQNFQDIACWTIPELGVLARRTGFEAIAVHANRGEFSRRNIGPNHFKLHEFRPAAEAAPGGRRAPRIALADRAVSSCAEQRSKTLLACSYSFGKYGDYLPLYIYCLLRAYPETASARMYYGGRLGDNARRALDIVARTTTGRFEVIEQPPIPLTPDHYGPGVRFLMGREHFAGYRYGYIADVDNLILPEDPGLVADEVAKAGALGQPYANVVRTAPRNRQEMCGWHFFEVEPYFASMQPVIEAAWADHAAYSRPKVPPPDAQWRSFDEHMLYRMVKEGLGLLEWDGARPYAWINRHGMHLGPTRVGACYPDWWRDNPLFRARALELLADPNFLKLRALLPSQIECQVAALDAFFQHSP